MAAIPHYQRAVELDPNFAIAYARMAVMYYNAGAGEIVQGVEFTKKAFALIDRVTERERLYISSQYYSYVVRDLDKTIEAYQAYARTYPRDFTPHVNLGSQYLISGQLEKAVEEFLEALRLEPRAAVTYSNLVWTYSALGRFDEAKVAAEKAYAQKIDSPVVHQWLLRSDYLQGDQAAVEREIQWLAGKPEE